tara:strand:- start:1 stop:1284 length:1284 start_codon:yes stop_codon:yes gene_type:complete
MSRIIGVKARQVLDSRGTPTVEAEVKTLDGVYRAIVPSGASTGVHEAVELRDKGKHYFSAGVSKAVNNVNSIIAKAIKGQNSVSQKKIDEIMIKLDGTPNKGKLGANAILAVSMAVCKAGSASKHLPLYDFIGKLYGVDPKVMPVPMCNVINGGKHAGQENSIQEHMLIPSGAKSYSEGLMMVVESYHQLKVMLKKKYGASGILLGDEGGFAPKQLTKMEDRFSLMLKAVKKAGYDGKVDLAIDAAASEFYAKGKYTLEGKKYDADQLIRHYEKLASKYPLVSLEDGFAEDDWKSWVKLNSHLGKEVQLVGDDLFVTNTLRIEEGILKGAANAVLIKVNQIGTVSETLDAMKMAHEVGWSSIISHRSGETEDAFIANLAVGTNDGQCKFGAPARSERVTKYNELLYIEEDLGEKAVYPGKDFRKIGL